MLLTSAAAQGLRQGRGEFCQPPIMAKKAPINAWAHIGKNQSSNSAHGTVQQTYWFFQKTVPPAIVEPEDQVDGTWCTCKQFARCAGDIPFVVGFQGQETKFFGLRCSTPRIHTRPQ